MEGSSLLGFLQLKVMVLPVMDSMTGVPSGGSGRMSAEVRGQISTSEPARMVELERRPTCDVEVRVACGFAHFVGDDALVDASVHVAHGADDQAVHVADCGRQRKKKNGMKRL